MNNQHAPELRVPVASVDHVLGPEHARVTVVEYGDFECPNCKQAAPALKLLLKHFAGQVRIVFRHFPLEEVHPHALAAAEAAETAAAQGKFWEMHDLLFENQRHLKAANLRTYAEQLQLDMARYTAEMDDEIYRQRVREHIEGGRRSGVRSTPGIFVNGVIQDVSFGMQSLFDAVQATLHK
jgi:protein-disulfide isomerase